MEPKLTFRRNVSTKQNEVKVSATVCINVVFRNSDVFATYIMYIE